MQCLTRLIFLSKSIIWDGARHVQTHEILLQTKICHQKEGNCWSLQKMIFITFCQARGEWIFHGAGKTALKSPKQQKTETRKYIYNFLYFIIFIAHHCPVSWSYLKNCGIFLILRIIGLNKHFSFFFQIFEEEHSVLYLDQGGVLVAMKHTSLPIRHLW